MAFNSLISAAWLATVGSADFFFPGARLADLFCLFLAPHETAALGLVGLDIEEGSGEDIGAAEAK